MILKPGEVGIVIDSHDEEEVLDLLAEQGLMVNRVEKSRA